MLATINLKLLAALPVLAMLLFIVAILFASRQPWYRNLPEDIKNQFRWETPKWLIKFGPWIVIINVLLTKIIEWAGFSTSHLLYFGQLALLLCPVLVLGAWAMTKSIRTHVSLSHTHPDASVRTFAAWSLAAYAFMILIFGGVATVAGIAYWG